jgi:hypothetical protein
MKVLHHRCSTNSDEGCDCGAAEANAYIAYLHEKIAMLEAELVAQQVVMAGLVVLAGDE